MLLCMGDTLFNENTTFTQSSSLTLKISFSMFSLSLSLSLTHLLFGVESGFDMDATLVETDEIGSCESLLDNYCHMQQNQYDLATEPHYFDG